MQRAYRQTGTRYRALDLHQATGVDRHDSARAGSDNGIDLRARHAARHFSEFHGKGASEPAAFLGGVHFAEFKTSHMAQQAARTLLDLQFAEGMAAVVVGNDVVEARADVFDLRDVQQEPGEFVNPGFERMDARQIQLVVREQFREVVRDHRRAGARGHHYVFGFGKYVQEMERHLAGLFAIAAVEGRLAATGLSFWKADIESRALKDIRHGETHVWKNLIDYAGNKKGNPFGHRRNF